MIYRAIFHLNSLPEQVRAVIEWSGAHPGHEIETLLRKFTSSFIEVKNVVNICYTLSDTLFFLHWEGDHGHILLQSMDLVDFGEWVSIVWHLINNSNCDINTCRETINNRPEPFADTLQPVPYEHLQETFPNETGICITSYIDFQTFSNLFYSISYFRPWIINFLENISIDPEKSQINIKYSHLLMEHVNLSELETLERAYYDGDEEIRLLLNQSSSQCFNFFFESRHEKFAQYVKALCSLVEAGKVEALETIKALTKHIPVYIEINRIFTIEKINSLLSTITANEQETSPAVVQTVLDLSMVLYNNGILDLAKIAEGSAFELSLRLDDVQQKGIFYKKFMENSIRWGPVHIVGLLNILTGVIGDSKEEKEIYAEIIEPVAKLVEDTREGKQALVEAYLQANKIDKAVSYKFKMTEDIKDEEQMAREIFKSIRWMITQDKISQKVLREILETYLPRALDKSVPGESLHKEILYIFEDIEARNLDALLVRVTSVIIKNLNYIALIDRYDVLHLILSRLEKDPKFNDLSAAVKGKMFEVAIEEGMEDRAEIIFQEILGLLSPDAPDYHASFIRFVKRVLIASAKFNAVKYIEFVMDMIYSIINTPELIEAYKNDFFDLINEAIRNTEKIPTSEDEHPGIRLYKHAYRLALAFNSPELVVKFIEEAPHFAFSKEDYKAYAKFVTLQIQVEIANNGNWRPILIKSLNSLVGVKQYQIANELIDEILLGDVSDEDKLAVFKRQLEIAEKVDDEYLSLTEIQQVREKVISLSKTADSDAEVLEQYRKTVKEFIELGMLVEAMDKTLDSLEFTLSIGASPTEFKEQLLELFGKYVEEEQDRTTVVRVVFSVVRRLTNIVEGAPLTVIPFVRLSSRVMMEKTSLLYTRIFLREILRKVSETMDFLGMSDKRELITIISGVEKTLQFQRSDINSVLMNFKIRFELHSAISNSSKLIELVDSTLSSLKAGSYRDKKPRGSLITAFFLISQSFIEISERIGKDDKRKFVHIVINFIESILPIIPTNSNMYTQTQEILDLIRENPDGTLYNLGFHIKALQEGLDEIR